MFDPVALVIFVFRAVEFLIIASVIVSWIPSLAAHPAGLKIKGLTEPILRPFRQLLPPHKTAGLDFSPLFAFIVVRILERILVGFLYGY